MTATTIPILTNLQTPQKHNIDQTREVIAAVGSAGRSSGPHLHFSVWQDGTAIDPLTFMASKGVSIS